MNKIVILLLLISYNLHASTINSCQFVDQTVDRTVNISEADIYTKLSIVTSWTAPEDCPIFVGIKTTVNDIQKEEFHWISSSTMDASSKIKNCKYSPNGITNRFKALNCNLHF